MMRNAFLVIIWFPLTTVLLLFNLTLLAQTSKSESPAVQSKIYPNTASAGRLTASAETAKILGMNVVAGDARALLLQAFLDKHGSPMASYADLIVGQADLNNLDFRLVVAIAMCESNLGRHMPSKDSFNPFGIAVYTGQDSGKKFANWEHAIIWVSRYLKENYFNRGINSLEAIGSIWAPPSVQTGNSWANCVGSFQQNIL